MEYLSSLFSLFHRDAFEITRGFDTNHSSSSKCLDQNLLLLLSQTDFSISKHCIFFSQIISSLPPKFFTLQIATKTLSMHLSRIPSSQSWLIFSHHTFHGFFPWKDFQITRKQDKQFKIHVCGWLWNQYSHSSKFAFISDCSLSLTKLTMNTKTFLCTGHVYLESSALPFCRLSLLFWSR